MKTTPIWSRSISTDISPLSITAPAQDAAGITPWPLLIGILRPRADRARPDPGVRRVPISFLHPAAGPHNDADTMYAKMMVPTISKPSR
jgi:hypothetical protein